MSNPDHLYDDESWSDLRMRVALYLGRDVRSDEKTIATMHEVLDRAEADANQLRRLRDTLAPGELLDDEEPS